jgi:GAF domain-containing protein
MDEQADLLGRLTKVVAATTPAVPLTHRLCLALVEISGLDGASMSIGYTAPSRTTLCSTDAIAERIEELQDLSREGPGLDAHRQRQVVEVLEPEIETRWPMFSQSFADHPRPGHLLAAPMRPDSEVLGVLTLYAASPAPLEVSPDQVQFLANAIGVAVLGGFERAEDTDELWSTRDLINQATGMVVAQLRIRPADALALLRAHAFAHDTSVGAIAADVAGRSLIFSPDPTTGTEQDG